MLHGWKGGRENWKQEVQDRNDLMAINITRRDENFNNGVVAWTDDDELHVMSDADGVDVMRCTLMVTVSFE
jgi:hypothetical protein